MTTSDRTATVFWCVVNKEDKEIQMRRALIAAVIAVLVFTPPAAAWTWPADDRVEIVRAELGTAAGVIGAALVAYDELG